MSQVRFAKLEDIPALVELGRQIHVKSRYAWMQFNAGRLWTALESAITHKQHCVIVASEDDSFSANLIGILWARVQSLPFSGDFVAQIDYLYVIPIRRGSPVAMKMMAGLRRWADNREVVEILLPNAFGIDEVSSAKLFNKLGLRSVGGMHSMWVDRK